jgi:hypothetical protein
MDYTITANYERLAPTVQEDEAPVEIYNPANYGEEF